MASSPDRISSGASATVAAARRPMASLILASTSAGPAVCKITSSAPHSALTAARPPSVTIAKSGQSRPVACSRRQMLLACTSSRRASTSTASAGGASTSADASAGSTRTGCSRSPSAGSTSADGSSTLVISSRSLTGRHLHSVRSHLSTCINRQGPGGNSARVRPEKDNSHGQSDHPVLGRGPRGRGRRARIGRGGDAGGGAGGRRGPARPRQPAALGAGLRFVPGGRHGGALLRYALHLTGGDRQRAEDLVQETIVRAWRHPEALADRPARPWLFAVARNLAVDSYRARQARPPETGQAALELLPSDDDADRTLESWAVADALASLRPDHRRVIVETYYRGCSVAEAA